METKHTATPWMQRGWEVKNMPTPGRQQEHIADCVEQADAAFIVRACNAHDQMRDALLTAERLLCGQSYNAAQLAEAVKQIRAALAKAGVA